MNNTLKISANALNEKKATDISAIKVADLTTIAEYFLLATATSTTHVRALADEVETKLSEAGIESIHIEGKATGWILLDYGDVIIHVFTKETRQFYQLDKLWNDGKIVNLETVFESVAEEN